MLNPVTHEVPRVEPKAIKDRNFGEYINVRGHRCPCFAEGHDGPPQYEPNDVYFCFSKFSNPFTKNWISRYAAMSVMTPVIDILHEAERQEGRPLMPPEWALIKGCLIQGFRPLKTTARGMQSLAQKVEMWLKGNMVDEIDHRLLDVTTAKEWKIKHAELVALYGKYPWASQPGFDPKVWMRMPIMTNVLEMLRQTDYRYTVMSPRYEEPPKPEGAGEDTEKKTRAAAGALAELESVDTTATQEELLDSPQRSRKDWD